MDLQQVKIKSTLSLHVCTDKMHHLVFVLTLNHILYKMSNIQIKTQHSDSYINSFSYTGNINYVKVYLCRNLQSYLLKLSLSFLYVFTVDVFYS